MEDNNTENTEEYILDEINGMHHAKRSMAILNRKKLSKHQMDEIFL